MVDRALQALDMMRADQEIAQRQTAAADALSDALAELAATHFEQITLRSPLLDTATRAKMATGAARDQLAELTGPAMRRFHYETMMAAGS